MFSFVSAFDVKSKSFQTTGIKNFALFLSTTVYKEDEIKSIAKIAKK